MTGCSKVEKQSNDLRETASQNRKVMTTNNCVLRQDAIFRERLGATQATRLFLLREGSAHVASGAAAAWPEDLCETRVCQYERTETSSADAVGGGGGST